MGHSYLKVGVRGSFSSPWGNLDSSVDGVVFINTDTNVETTIQLNKDLFKLDAKYVYPVFTYGPIILKISASSTINVPLTVSMPVDSKFSFRAAFAGMYEGGVKVSLDYGVRMQKVRWFIYKPVPYCESGSSAWAQEKTIYYIGSSSSNSIAFKGVTASTNPNFTQILRADVSDCIYTEIVGRTGLSGQLAIDYTKPVLTGTATVKANAGITAEAGIGLNVPIINQWYGKKWNWNLIGPSEKQLASWQVFKKTL